MIRAVAFALGLTTLVVALPATLDVIWSRHSRHALIDGGDTAL